MCQANKGCCVGKARISPLVNGYHAADGQDGQMIAYGAIEGMSDRSRSDDHRRDFGHRQFDGATAEATRWTAADHSRTNHRNSRSMSAESEPNAICPA